MPIAKIVRQAAHTESGQCCFPCFEQAGHDILRLDRQRRHFLIGAEAPDIAVTDVGLDNAVMRFEIERCFDRAVLCDVIGAGVNRLLQLRDRIDPTAGYGDRRKGNADID